MEEKLIVISINDEIVDSFIDIHSIYRERIYCQENGVEFIDFLEFEGFIFVEAKFK